MSAAASPTVALSSVVCASEHQLSSDVSGEAVILDLERSVYYGLDPVGATVWRLLTTPRPVNELVDAVLAEFEVDRDRCERDVVALLQEMAARGLVEVRDGTAP